MRVLISGGAGYIGSHTAVLLAGAGHEVEIVDNLVNAKPTVLPRIEQLAGTTIPLHILDLCDREATDALVAAGNYDAVIHFAGLKAVGESVERPLDYYDNNLNSTISLVRAMGAHGVRRLVFSSSATVYGDAAQPPLMEKLPTSATNPYGWTKVMIEQVLRDVAAADVSWRIALLRYFNPIGAHPSGDIGEDPQGIPNNLVPYIAQVAVGRREFLNVWGNDYPTADGTGERDYIHVMDLAAGHVAALEKLDEIGRPVNTWNLGTGKPASVLQVLAAFSAAVGRDLPYRVMARRPGDVPTSYADPHLAEIELDWRADRTLDQMCADTWRWQSQNPTGYPDA
ncbi:MAG TPA: UDP-glucose 4-epimerase GalE [Phycicoccus elongatus]|uniref:UDP-glucose 4-epimerase GalE n=1 Tax=Phycicoccus TaxID=367298 RepID=UPI002588C400|nr:MULTISPECIES: UDP-glucose 4-epimerase GalE [Phycicoccus]MCA0323265.1 UDP-glucose 4-epimerase GalE [Actinomycetota bacterium]MCB9406535.1 UDP-glucose 4-epimerase GalE [Tetrasphaera sp.]MCO5303836.1 UDP-glucose 4-epimerase GalE [Phycicoccus sp.]HPK12638.1 UDP-glucose 4-epimerase GalE [Phycicoccus elongatus]HPQ73803.1 UDP-glucose 4-epimerase GalE [Phycicoccus elongatus]